MSRFDRLRRLKPAPKLYHTVIIVGCGGVGGNIAHMFLRMEPKYIVVFDDDILETHNLTRVLFPEEKIGERKDYAFVDSYWGWRKNTTLIPVGKYKLGSIKTVLEALKIPKEADTLIVDAVDVVDVSNHVVQEVKALSDEGWRLSYLGANYDGWEICVRYYPPESVGGIPERVSSGEEGYTVIPSYVGNAEAVALLGFLYSTALHREKAVFCVDLLKLLKFLSGGGTKVVGEWKGEES